MGARLQHSSRTADQAFREINRCGRLRPDPEFVAGQRALQAASGEKKEGESQLVKTIRSIVNPYPKEN